MPIHPLLSELRDKIGVELPSLEDAYTRATSLVDDAKNRLKGIDLPPTSSIVTLGSLARGEATDGSDLDWFVLHDGPAHQEPTKVLPTAKERLEQLGLPPPSPAGPFARIVNASELVQYIGLEEDTNKNVTQRVVLLLESTPVIHEDIHRGVVECVLRRYLEDIELRAPGSGRFVPQFLLNDIVRYWRTVCVDYQAKKRLEERKWALRNVKLRHSRKVLFAGSLATLLECRDQDDVLSFLQDRLAEPPLAQLAHLLLTYEMLEPAKRIFEVYDRFLGLLGSPGMREHLEELPFSEFETDGRFNLCRQMSRSLQEGLEAAFFEGHPDVANAIKRYGVF